jgi:hypothetical protein
MFGALGSALRWGFGCGECAGAKKFCDRSRKEHARRCADCSRPVSKMLALQNHVRLVDCRTASVSDLNTGRGFVVTYFGKQLFHGIEIVVINSEYDVSGSNASLIRRTARVYDGECDSIASYSRILFRRRP